MPRTIWIAQQNSDRQLQQACLTEGRGYQEVVVPPRTNVFLGMPEVAGPFVLFGRATMMLTASEHPFWRRGMFFDPSRFRHSAYVRHFGERMLNADAEVMSWRVFLDESRTADLLSFVKPNDDLKYFEGSVRNRSEWTRLHESLVASNPAFDPDSEVVVGEPREVDAEWRLVFVEGTVVAGSQFRPSGNAAVPAEVIAFAEAAVRDWCPDPVFVMDVARSDGTWRIVECNCFNGSRFYLADVRQIVRSVSEFQERRWGEAAE